MSLGRKDRYVVFVGGEIEHDTESRDDAMSYAHGRVEQDISDFYKHGLPLKVTKEIETRVDVYVAKITQEAVIELPLQSWFDDYYNEVKQYEAEEEKREWKRYLELREKFKDRIAESEGGERGD